jgi:signal transduction histidine kinase
MFDSLRKSELFGELSDDDLQRLCLTTEYVRLAAGETLFTQGSPGDKAYFIQEGLLEILNTAGGREVLIAVRKPGELIGEMSLLEETPRSAEVRARADSLLFAIGKQQFEQLFGSSPAALKNMLHTVLFRLRETQAMLQHSERMAQLGTLTAGVAHELNNPASAARRAADQLFEELPRFKQAQSALQQLALTPNQQEKLSAEIQRAEQQAGRPPELDALVRSDQESSLESWLETHGVSDSWQLAPALVDLAYDAARLEDLAREFGPEQFGVVIQALNASYLIQRLSIEIGQAAGRISELVRALKGYSYLDQGPVQPVDLHQGLEDTLMILRGKINQGISVRREYAEDLPRIQGYGSELNQVWTNLIDNALDAVDGAGEIVLRTRREGDRVVVEVNDNGPGIPEEIQGRVFDQFFTTKDLGKGTGLGLDISYRIVVDKHRGDIRLSSQPGNTRFEVWLPVNFEAAG